VQGRGKLGLRLGDEALVAERSREASAVEVVVSSGPGGEEASAKRRSE
jgi:hypothetical protein